ncbi:MAG: hypothetical protein H7Z72_20550 [Bacteroidetes bacterium]|nr:hypothetical protein [Fibrella sp.]
MSDKKVIRIDELDAGHPLRQDPFRAPEGYFNDLPMQIQARIQAQQPAPAFTMSWSWQRSVASLAGVGLVAALVWVTLPERQETLGQETLSSVSNEAIASYLEDQGIDADELASQGQPQMSFASDTTMFQYLNVQPADIQLYIDENQETMDETLELGS